MTMTTCSALPGTVPGLAPLSIPALLFASAERHAGRVALEENGVATDYRDLPALALGVCRSLIALGIEAGDRVAIWAPNCRDWVIGALGIHCAGAVLVPINTRMKGAEAADILLRSEARVLLMQGEFLGVDYQAMLAPLRPATLQRLVVFGAAQPQTTADLDWAGFLAQGAAVSEVRARQRAVAVGPRDLSDILYTSGTTGRPKGVMCAHGQTLRAYTEYARVIGLQPGDRYLVINPFFHAFGYKAGWLTCLLAGATILPHAVFDAEVVFQRIAAERVSVLPGPPTLYLSMLAHPHLGQTDLSSLRIAVTGSSTIPPVLIERMRNELGIDVVTTAYGLTECGGLATLCDPGAPADIVAGTSGAAIDGTEICIRAPDNQPLAQGESGEICLRGYHVMRGYFNDPEATAQAIDADGWLHTGDIGNLDAQGNLQITDRLKDMFIVGGFNCYPAEIEAGLIQHPAIAQVAVIGVADARMGEVGCACVVLRPHQQLDEPALIAWARERMANYKVPRQVRFFQALPVNASNKVVKGELRQAVQAQQA